MTRELEPNDEKRKAKYYDDEGDLICERDREYAYEDAMEEFLGPPVDEYAD